MKKNMMYDARPVRRAMHQHRVANRRALCIIMMCMVVGVPAAIWLMPLIIKALGCIMMLMLTPFL